MHSAHTLSTPSCALCALSCAVSHVVAACCARVDALSLYAGRALSRDTALSAQPCRDPRAQVATPGGHLCRDRETHVATGFISPTKASRSRHKRSGRNPKTSIEQHLYHDIKPVSQHTKSPSCPWPCRDLRVPISTLGKPTLSQHRMTDSVSTGKPSVATQIPQSQPEPSRNLMLWSQHGMSYLCRDIEFSIATENSRRLVATAPPGTLVRARSLVVHASLSCRDTTQDHDMKLEMGSNPLHFLSCIFPLV